MRVQMDALGGKGSNKLAASYAKKYRKIKISWQTVLVLVKQICLSWCSDMSD